MPAVPVLAAASVGKVLATQAPQVTGVSATTPAFTPWTKAQKLLMSKPMRGLSAGLEASAAPPVGIVSRSGEVMKPEVDAATGRPKPMVIPTQLDPWTEDNYAATQERVGRLLARRIQNG